MSDNGVVYSPYRIEADPAMKIERRELWCPCDYRVLKVAIGRVGCVCGLTVTISADDLLWANEHNDGE